jgi:hypothetical protein
MRAIALLVGIAASALPALAQTSVAQPEPLMHVSTSFDLTVRASYAKTAPLFGPEGERPWAGKHWNPEFIHPQPAADIEGAVFTVQHGPYKAVWVNTLFDLEARHFQYVYFLPGLMVTVIDVRFKTIAADLTGVHVTYTRTALTPEGNEHVSTMTEGDKTAGTDWQKALDEYLAGTSAGAKP